MSFAESINLWWGLLDEIPFCSNEDTIKDSRPTEDNTSIRRRRICDQCGSRFTTFERIQLRDLVVVKNKGQKENFDELNV